MFDNTGMGGLFGGLPVGNGLQIASMFVNHDKTRNDMQNIGGMMGGNPYMGMWDQLYNLLNRKLPDRSQNNNQTGGNI